MREMWNGSRIEGVGCGGTSLWLVFLSVLGLQLQAAAMERQTCIGDHDIPS